MWIKHGFFRNGGNGKTLTLNMTERFFSDRFAGQPDVFRDMEIADDEEMMKRQGTFPVISMTLMTAEGNCFEEFLVRIAEERIRKYGFGFRGKDIRILKG